MTRISVEKTLAITTDDENITEIRQLAYPVCGMLFATAARRSRERESASV